MAFRKGLVLAMEDDAEVEVSEGDGSVVSDLEASEVDSDTTSEAGEIEELGSDIEGANSDVDTMMDAVDVAEDSVTPDENGEGGEGLTEPAAEMMGVLMRSVCSRLGIDSSSIIPATESFGSTSSRVAATNVAIETIGETIKRAWEAIKRAFKTIWEKITNFLTSAFNSVSRLKKSVEAAKTYYKAQTKDATLSNETFKNKSIWKAFCNAVTNEEDAIDVSAVSDMFKNLEKFNGLYDGYYKNYNQYCDESDKLIAELKDANKSAGFFNKDSKDANKLAFATKFSETVKTLFVNNLFAGLSGDRKASLYLMNGQVMDGFAPEIEVRDSEAELIKHLKGLKYTISVDTSGMGKKSGEKVTTLRAGEFDQVLALATNAINFLDNARKNDPKKLASKIDSLLSKAISYSDKSNKENFKIQKLIISGPGNLAAKLASRFPVQCIKFVKAVVNYSNASAKEYKKAAK